MSQCSISTQAIYPLLCWCSSLYLMCVSTNFYTPLLSLHYLWLLDYFLGIVFLFFSFLLFNLYYYRIVKINSKQWSELTFSSLTSCTEWVWRASTKIWSIWFLQSFHLTIFKMADSISQTKILNFVVFACKLVYINFEVMTNLK